MKGKIMGLSASQAKLLSITSRISDNELRSQTITSAKMALANQSTAASKDYVNALNTTKLTYSTYDLNGNKAYVNLTGSQLSQYAPLKNQYALINNKGQVLVSETDAKNYDDSADMEEFLAKYGIEKTDTGKTQTVTNPEYQPAYDKWKENYEEWKKNYPKAEDYTKEIPSTDNELYQKFKQASQSCYDNATAGGSGCYLHVLAHMLDLDPTYATYPKTFKTSTGEDLSIDSSRISGSAINGANQTPNMVPISDAVRDGYNGKTLMATEHSSENLTASSTEYEKLFSDYYLKEALKNGKKADSVQQLLSNYKYSTDANGNTTVELKTLRQKCIDLYYAVDNFQKLGINYDDILIPAIKTFQEDMSLAFTEQVLDEDAYNQAISDYGEAPKMEEIPATITEKVYTYGDGDQAQWYVNLWHRMNGASTDKDGMQTTTTTNTTIGEDGKLVVDKKETTQSRWDILEDGLMNSADWLQYALESGTITLERANFENPTEKGTGLANVKWTSIIYTNALDISEETDEAAITKAEAEYESKTKDIEAKDKQYDNMLKLLDTEHSALQSEYDSVKTVISKNTERTLKMYSA